MKEAFLAAFFLRVGLVGVPAQQDLGLVLLLVGFLLLKGGLFYGLLVAFKLKSRTAFITSVPLTSFSGFTLVIGFLASEAGLLSPSIVAVLAVATGAARSHARC